MILLLEPGLDAQALSRIEAVVRRAGGDPRRLAGTDGATGASAIEARGCEAVDFADVVGIARVLDAPSAYPKVARGGRPTRVVVVGSGRARTSVGAGELCIVAGPCAVESPEQLDASALAASNAGATILRGGAYKPRTSPYSFQGLGEEGLPLLRAIADRHGLAVLTEVMDPAAVGVVATFADALQVGSRNMQNFPLLRAVGRQRRPVVLKRGMSATLEEWLLAAEYIAQEGNQDIILCERGVRSFDPASRNLLDLAAVPLLRARTHLPILVDPSHGVGVRHAIGPMALAAVAAGADGLMLECHPDPGLARSDGFQALTPAELLAIADRARAVALAVRGEGLRGLPSE